MLDYYVERRVRRARRRFLGAIAILALLVVISDHGRHPNELRGTWKGSWSISGGDESATMVLHRDGTAVVRHRIVWDDKTSAFLGSKTLDETKSFTWEVRTPYLWHDYFCLHLTNKHDEDGLEGCGRIEVGTNIRWDGVLLTRVHGAS